MCYHLLMASITHPLTGETVELDVEAARAELERAHGLDLSDLSATSVAMNYSALLRQRDRDADA